MPSAFEDQAVDDIDFSSLSDAELHDIVDNDDRVTAQEKAQAELNRRENDSGDSTSTRDPSADISVTSATSPDDPVARAEAFGINAEGVNTDPDAGQRAVQDYFDRVEESGVIPPTGGPPDDSLTLGAVTDREQADKEARREAQEEAWSQ